MATNLVMPKMGYDMTEGKILRWLKNEGDAVTKGEAIAEIQTEKVNIEIEAFDSGILARILHGAGEDVPVGQTIGILAQPGEQVSAAAMPEAPAAAPQAEPAAATRPARAELEHPLGGRIKASPLARRMAAERGLDLAALHGSGPGGRIVRRDVEAYVPTTRPTAAPAAMRGDRHQPLSRMRQAIARRLSESKVAAPHFYVTSGIDMTEAIAFRAQLNATLGETAKVSFTDLIIRAVVLACERFPQVNASWGEGEIVERGAINVGIAVALPDGLVVPVLRDAQDLRLVELARHSRELIDRARAGKLRPEEMGEGTITVSNLGAYDVESFTAILNPPESAILAIGSIAKEPVVDEQDQIRIRSRMRVTMSSDHRVIDGATAAQFLSELKRLLQAPLSLLV